MHSACAAAAAATAAVATMTADAARCGGRHLATRNELPPFPGPDNYALLFLLNPERAPNTANFLPRDAMHSAVLFLS